MQRSDIPNPAFPDSITIIGVDPNGESYTQHYFDSRGVVCLYAMPSDAGRWTLMRSAPDFTPLDFSQWFTGAFAEDGNSIDAAWETSHDGVHWEHDVDHTYTRVT